jgi:D-alanyl-D-alanine carboxypeptidase
MLLCERCGGTILELGLDDPVAKYQPAVPNGAHITIRELLHMTSGLYSYDEDLGFFKSLSAQPETVYDAKDLLAVSFRHRPYFAPGKGWHYSNTNYILLGLIIEQLTSQPVADAFQQRIFTPLGMTESSLPERTTGAIPVPHPRGYYYAEPKAYAAGGTPADVTSWNPSWGWTAGAAISTLHDLRIWAKALATGRLLSAAMQKQRLQWVPLPGSRGRTKYGLALADIAGYLGHNGEVPGFQSFMGYQPHQGRTIVVLANLATLEPTGPADALATIIIKALAATSPR